MPKPLQTVRDDRGYSAALQRLDELEAERLAADADLQSALALREQFDPIGAEAEQLVFGGGEADPVPDVQALQRRVEVLRRAVALQKTVVDAARVAAFRPLCQSAKPEHAKLVRRWIETGRSFLESGESVRTFISDLQTKGDGASLTSPIADFGIDPLLLARLKSALDQLANASEGY